MTANNELPEYQIFTILRQGETEPLGPYSQNQIVELLNEGSINPTDFVHYADLADWTPIRDVFDLHQKLANFSDDGQDSNELAEVFNAIIGAAGDGENVFYIAIQDRQALRGFRGHEAVGVSDRFIWIARHKMGGKLTLDELELSNIRDVWAILKAGEKTGTFHIEQENGVAIQVERIPALQLERITKTTRELLQPEPIPADQPAGETAAVGDPHAAYRPDPQ